MREMVADARLVDLLALAQTGMEGVGTEGTEADGEKREERTDGDPVQRAASARSPTLRANFATLGAITSRQ